MAESKTRGQQGQAFALIYFGAVFQFVVTMIVMGWAGIWSVGPVVALGIYFAMAMREEDKPL